MSSEIIVLEIYAATDIAEPAHLVEDGCCCRKSQTP
jgi:hypothetical protein